MSDDEEISVHGSDESSNSEQRSGSSSDDSDRMDLEDSESELSSKSRKRKGKSSSKDKETAKRKGNAKKKDSVSEENSEEEENENKKSSKRGNKGKGNEHAKGTVRSPLVPKTDKEEQQYKLLEKLKKTLNMCGVKSPPLKGLDFTSAIEKVRNVLLHSSPSTLVFLTYNVMQVMKKEGIREGMTKDQCKAFKIKRDLRKEAESLGTTSSLVNLLYLRHKNALSDLYH